jgi:hypothetical protein
MHKVPFNFYNQVSGGATPMPRPKSELTGDSKNVGIRLTQSQYEEWKRLGGPKWLRKELSNKLQEKKVGRTN